MKENKKIGVLVIPLSFKIRFVYVDRIIAFVFNRKTIEGQNRGKTISILPHVQSLMIDFSFAHLICRRPK